MARDSNEPPTPTGIKTPVNNPAHQNVSFKKQHTVLDKKLYSFNKTQSADEELGTSPEDSMNGQQLVYATNFTLAGHVD